jgi:hypothetical protein
MTRRKMILVGLVAAMLGVIVIGYRMHDTAPLASREEPLAPQTLITIKSYNATTQTYVIFPTKFPGEGDGTVSPTALANAIGTIKLDEILGDPQIVVGKSFQVDKPLELLSWEG